MPRRKDEVRAYDWCFLGYPENMLPDWETQIYDLIELPFAYCIHDIDHDTKSVHRKTHIHGILHSNHIMSDRQVQRLVSRLNKTGCNAFQPVQSTVNIRHAYDYLIHATDGAIKQGKELYDPKCRIEGNNFDIGAFEQLDETIKISLIQQLKDFILDRYITNYRAFELAVHLPSSGFVTQIDSLQLEKVLISYHTYFKTIIAGNYGAKTDQKDNNSNT